MTADNKITLQDLKISPDCWQWMASRTEDFCNRAKEFEAACNSLSYQLGIDRYLIIAFAELAIIGCNKEKICTIRRYETHIICYFSYLGLALIEQIFDYSNFDNEFTAYFSALQWIWQQEQGIK